MGSVHTHHRQKHLHHHSILQRTFISGSAAGQISCEPSTKNSSTWVRSNTLPHRLHHSFREQALPLATTTCLDIYISYNMPPVGRWMRRRVECPIRTSTRKPTWPYGKPWEFDSVLPNPTCTRGTCEENCRHEDEVLTSLLHMPLFSIQSTTSLPPARISLSIK
ncbi:hypothetical protein CPB86DRAFT_383454 [Serendipita vermifera]|nr:hypothetical protein CPB86DRAFT_383454 [Serendipita vermifera]